MEMMVKISAIGILAAVLGVLLRQSEKAVALGMSLLSCTAVLLLSVRFLQPIWEVVQRIVKLSGLGNGLTKPLLKVVGIGLLTQIAGSVCNEAGEPSLAKAVEISGSVLAVYASLPLFAALLTLAEKLIGGTF